MAALVQKGKRGSINTTSMTTMGYYVIKYYQKLTQFKEKRATDES